MVLATDCHGMGPFELGKHLLPCPMGRLDTPTTSPSRSAVKPFFISLLCEHLVFKCKQCFAVKLVLPWFFLRTLHFKQVLLDTI